MGLEPKLQTKLYEQFWRPMEVEFGQDAYGTHFDGFMRHYLTVKTAIFQTSARSMKHSNLCPFTQSGASWSGALVADIRAFSRYFCAMALA